MKNNKIRRIISKVKNTKVIGTFSLLVFIIQFLWYLFEPNYRVPIWLLSLAVIVIWLVWLITYTMVSSENIATYKLPAVRAIHNESKIIFILEKNELYNVDMLVSIYYFDEIKSYELFLGIGYIHNVNDNGHPQVVFLHIDEDKDNRETINSIIKGIKNDFETIRRIKVKPSVSKFYLKN